MFKQTEEVFNTNPRHFSDHQTPIQSENSQTESTSSSKHDIELQNSDKIQPTSDAKPKNVIWPQAHKKTDGQEEDNNDYHQLNEEKSVKVQNEETRKTEDSNISTLDKEVKEKKQKSILKSTNITSDNNESNQAIVNTSLKTNTRFDIEENHYYQKYDTVDDDLENKEEDIYYFEHTEEDKDDYVVHRGMENFKRNNSVSENEYEEPIYQDEGIVEDEKSNSAYNKSTNEFNVSFSNGGKSEVENDVGLNTFGNTRKLQYPGEYSNQAANIFFDDEDDYEIPTSMSKQIIFNDNASEMSA